MVSGTCYESRLVNTECLQQITDVLCTRKKQEVITEKKKKEETVWSRLEQGEKKDSFTFERMFGEMDLKCIM